MSHHQFGKVAVLMGGPSAEREVSLKSGARVLAALQKEGVDAHGVDADPSVLGTLRDEQYDRAFIILHGRWGEDGLMQGALDVLGIPYTGSGVLASALAMDKWRSKMLMRQAGLPTPDFALVRSELDLDQVASELGFPMVIKPSREGSSNGTFKVHSPEEMDTAWRRASEFDRDVLAEAWVEGQELTVAVLGNRPLPAIRIQAAGEIYDYEAKYLADSTQYFCPSGLDESIETKIRKLAIDTFTLLDCHGWGRVDFMIDKNGQPFVLETNTIPGMTDHSLVPMAAKADGINFEQLTVRILESSHATG
ncbi:MAG: D-alanine--D-alanine ligase [Acidiferrobacterales bacterium]